MQIERRILMSETINPIETGGLDPNFFKPKAHDSHDIPTILGILQNRAKMYGIGE